jgi:phosphatidylglycerol:prolipoprotein diacylglycerol transferase
MKSFWFWWQHLPAHMNPVILQIGSFRLQYYGLMYLVAFGLTYALASYRIRREKGWGIDTERLQGLLTAMIIGLIVGARLGYVIFYNPSYFMHHLLEIVLPFEFSNGIRFVGISGMSYHGGLIGTLIAAIWFVVRNKLDFRKTADLLIPCIPAGYTFGRLGNFINGELWGRTTASAIGMYFPNAPGSGLRHPSQLYEAFGEGVILFILLWQLRKKMRTPGSMLSLYLVGYGCIRFIIEFFREPDAQLGFVFLSFSMGQLLCSAMIGAGIALWIWFVRTDRQSDRSSKQGHGHPSKKG